MSRNCCQVPMRAEAKLIIGELSTIGRLAFQLLLIGPAEEEAAGGVAGAYGDDEDEVALVEAALVYGVAQP